MKKIETNILNKNLYLQNLLIFIFIIIILLINDSVNKDFYFYLYEFPNEILIYQFLILKKFLRV